MTVVPYFITDRMSNFYPVATPPLIARHEKKIKGAPGPMARLRRGARLLPMFMSSNKQNERLDLELACEPLGLCGPQLQKWKSPAGSRKSASSSSSSSSSFRAVASLVRPFICRLFQSSSRYVFPLFRGTIFANDASDDDVRGTVLFAKGETLLPREQKVIF